MLPLKETVGPRGRIMVVDDNPTNLRLMEDMLRQQQYEVRSFPRGRLAIASAEREAPELILLDINMPEMDGYQVCERLKADARFCEIPVIFLSALNATEDKVKGFRAGGADYVSKPLQFDEVQARIETHLRLRRAQQRESELLERTLGAAVETLLELVQLTSPLLVVRTQSIRGMVQWIIKRIGLKDAWQCDLAAMLCLIGCITVPTEVFGKAYAGQSLLPDDARAFRSHPEVAARLLSKIPRLETVVEIIRRQQIWEQDATATEGAKQGAKILHLAVEVDRNLYQGMDYSATIERLKVTGRFDRELLEILADYRPVRGDYDVLQLPLRDLRSGMILDEDVSTSQPKTLIIKEGVTLTEVWIERLENYKRSQGMQERLRVRIPRVGVRQ